MLPLKRVIREVCKVSLRYLRRLWLASAAAVVTAFMLGFCSGWWSAAPATVSIPPQDLFNFTSMVAIFIRNMAATSFLVFSGITVVLPSLMTFINAAPLSSKISGLLIAGHSLQQALAALLPHGVFEFTAIVYTSIESTHVGISTLCSLDVKKYLWRSIRTLAVSAVLLNHSSRSRGIRNPPHSLHRRLRVLAELFSKAQSPCY